MAKTIVDARGLPCPQPVIRTRNAMREADEITTLVSGADQVENVRRLAERAGWGATVEETADGYAVHLVKGEAKTTQEPQLTPDMLVCTTPGRVSGTVLVISGETMGRGEEELGSILIRSFMHTLSEIEPLPGTLIFFNTGVKLTVEGSPVLEDLKALQDRGVEILVCGTCLGYFDLKDKIAVGTISNMYTIAETILGASRTVVI
ncbi:MAG: sulfurtransferase-like selenium metabolism protein YedF [Chloroflexi bacterium]|nr:sulfurtransferase-like selenium metabolism protein YedF [Chloroflexota bacterium]